MAGPWCYLLQFLSPSPPTAAQFLHDNGVLLHYNDHLRGLNNLYFIDPAWLCDMLAEVIAVPEKNAFARNGILADANVAFLFKDTRKFPPQYLKQYLQLLERFEIALSLGDGTRLIPSMLAVSPPAYNFSSPLPQQPGGGGGCTYTPLSLLHTHSFVPTLGQRTASDCHFCGQVLQPISCSPPHNCSSHHSQLHPSPLIPSFLTPAPLTPHTCTFHSSCLHPSPLTCTPHSSHLHPSPLTPAPLALTPHSCILHSSCLHPPHLHPSPLTPAPLTPHTRTPHSSHLRLSCPHHLCPH